MAVNKPVEQKQPTLCDSKQWSEASTSGSGGRHMHSPARQILSDKTGTLNHSLNCFEV